MVVLGLNALAMVKVGWKKISSLLEWFIIDDDTNKYGRRWYVERIEHWKRGVFFV